MEDQLHAKVGLFSGGQRQTLSLTMATFPKPKMLLLDEHAAVLDPRRAALIMQVTHEAVECQHLTTLMVMYNMERTLSMGNRLIMIHEGWIIFELAGEGKKRATVISLLVEPDKLRGRREQGLSGRMLLTWILVLTLLHEVRTPPVCALAIDTKRTPSGTRCRIWERDLIRG